jgi:hypothetical protein
MQPERQSNPVQAYPVKSEQTVQLSPQKQQIHYVKSKAITGRSFKNKKQDSPSIKSVTSNDMTEENTFTIKMGEPDGKERELVKLLEQSQKENDKLISIIQK